MSIEPQGHDRRRERTSPAPSTQSAWGPTPNVARKDRKQMGREAQGSWVQLIFLEWWIQLVGRDGPAAWGKGLHVSCFGSSTKNEAGRQPGFVKLLQYSIFSPSSSFYLAEFCFSFWNRSHTVLHSCDNIHSEEAKVTYSWACCRAWTPTAQRTVLLMQNSPCLHHSAWKQVCKVRPQGCCGEPGLRGWWAVFQRDYSGQNGRKTWKWEWIDASP